MKKKAEQDTICAVATPPGRGGVGIIRLSGPDSFQLASALCPTQVLPAPRQAAYRSFYKPDDRDANQSIDQGLLLCFPGPHSFTGEDVCELHTHGSPIIQAEIIQALIQAGARHAEPGEFSQRAFLNGRMDLIQAEAIADLIAASSEQAARAAQRSMEGVFSQQVTALAEALTALRVWIEAALDFPDEEIDFLAEGKVVQQLEALLAQLIGILEQAQTGRVLTEGIKVAIVGAPNVGKSSLLNALSRRDTAIVTAIAGTTRDVVREQLVFAGLAMTLADTAGLRDTDDPIEAEGVARAHRELQSADVIWHVMDDRGADPVVVRAIQALPSSHLVITIRNKIDESGEPPGLTQEGSQTLVQLSALTGIGLDTLEDHMMRQLGLQETSTNEFSARQRHIEALQFAADQLTDGMQALTATGSGELLAEHLKTAADALASLTGAVTTDELLGRIFSEFCIGK